MKYFRFRDPEYALIAANSAEEAIKLYKENSDYFPTDIPYTVVQVPLNHLDSDERELLMLHLLYQNLKARKELLEHGNSRGEMLIDSLSYEEHLHPDHVLEDDIYDF